MARKSRFGPKVRRHSPVKCTANIRPCSGEYAGAFKKNVRETAGRTARGVSRLRAPIQRKRPRDSLQKEGEPNTSKKRERKQEYYRPEGKEWAGRKKATQCEKFRSKHLLNLSGTYTSEREIESQKGLKKDRMARKKIFAKGDRTKKDWGVRKGRKE